MSDYEEHAYPDEPSHQDEQLAAFHEAAGNVLESYQAFARDIGAMLPPEEWPVFVRNNLRDQGLLKADGTFGVEIDEDALQAWIAG